MARLRLISLLVAGGLVAAACGGGDDGAEPEGVEAYEPGGWETTAAIGEGLFTAREASAEEMAALTAVSDYLFESCEVLEAGDIGATIIR